MTSIENHGKEIRTSSSTFSHHCNVFWISSKTRDVPLDPHKGSALVTDAVICFVACFPKFI